MKYLLFALAISLNAQADLEDWQRLRKNWKYPSPIPAFTLLNQEGEKINLSKFKEDYVLVGFMYTRCPVMNACPMTTRLMTRIQKEWKKRADKEGKIKGKKLTLLSITLDPEHDTPPRLKEYARQWKADFKNWHFTTGPKGLVTDALPSLFNVAGFENGPALITHNVKLSLLAPGLKDLKDWKDNEYEPKKVVEFILKQK